MSQLEIIEEIIEKSCPLCDDPERECGYNFPEVEDFQEGGIFCHIKLPLDGNEKIPEEILKYIYGGHYFAGDVTPDHEINIRESLNNL